MPLVPNLLRGQSSNSGFVDYDSSPARRQRTRFGLVVKALGETMKDSMPTPRRVKHYWHFVLENPRARRPPMVTLSFLTVCFVVYFNVPGHGSPYQPGPAGAWNGPLISMVSHLNEEHLYSNSFMLILLGWFLEFTEGFRHTAAVIYGGGCLGSAMHGVFKPSKRVRGASGAIYGVMWSQLSLLALNWKEMPARWVRLILCMLLLGFDGA
jgi:membrane associated rhomboid family serine protease